MKLRIFILLALLGALLCGEAYAQRVTNSSFQTIGYIKSDGTIQDSSFRTLGYAPGISMAWVAWFFFF